MQIIEILKYLGIETPSFIAGMSGGIAVLTKNKDMTKVQKFFTIMSGGCIANYLTPVMVYYFNLDNKLVNGVAFLLGYSGLKIVESIIKMFNNKLRKNDDTNSN